VSGEANTGGAEPLLPLRGAEVTHGPTNWPFFVCRAAARSVRKGSDTTSKVVFNSREYRAVGRSYPRLWVMTAMRRNGRRTV
jgi:hypothetical protein